MSLPSSLTSRIAVLDVLRGICILGILLANIVAFGGPVIGYEVGFELVLTRSEEILEGLREWLVAGKFRGMLSVLFGFGMAMQFAKFQARESADAALPGLRPLEKWPGKYLKRTLLLAAIGAFHGLFLWFGDILFMYALTALVAMWMMRMSRTAIGWTVVGCGALSLLMGLGIAAMTSVAGEDMGLPEGFMAYLSPERETAVYASGSYGLQFLYRAGMFVMSALNAPMIVIPLLGLFLFGVWLQRAGVLTAPFEHKRELGVTALVGVLAFATNFLGFAKWYWGWSFDTSNLIEIGLSPIWAGCLIVLLAALIQKTGAGGIWMPFAKVGKVALTCYLMQTVLCTFYFYSYGFGMFGKLDRVEQLFVVGVVWLINIVFAWVWLARFDIGPVEWAWRSMVEGRKLPWKRTEEAVLPPVLG